MQILIDKNKHILFAADRIEFGIFDEPNVSKWAFFDDDEERPKLYALDDNYTKIIYEGELPSDIDIWGKYLYDGTQIVPDPTYREPEEELDAVEASRRIRQLENLVAQLMAERDDVK